MIVLVMRYCSLFVLLFCVIVLVLWGSCSCFRSLLLLLLFGLLLLCGRVIVLVRAIGRCYCSCFCYV